MKLKSLFGRIFDAKTNFGAFGGMRAEGRWHVSVGGLSGEVDCGRNGRAFCGF